MRKVNSATTHQKCFSHNEINYITQDSVPNHRSGRCDFRCFPPRSSFRIRATTKKTFASYLGHVR